MGDYGAGLDAKTEYSFLMQEEFNADNMEKK